MLTTMSTVAVHALHKRYGRDVALDDVSFEVADGEILGILGPNGAGKTTLVECIEGLRVPDGGRVTVAGLDPRTDAREVRQLLGAQLQHSALPDKLRVGEALALYASFYRSPADTDELLAAVGLSGRRDAFYGTLSGGQQQRLSIALAFVGNPRVVVLDELTTGLDPAGRQEVWALIGEMRNRGVTMLLVTHDLVEAERLCDRLTILVGGRVAALGTPDELVRQAGVSEPIVPARPPALDHAYLALSASARREA